MLWMLMRVRPIKIFRMQNAKLNNNFLSLRDMRLGNSSYSYPFVALVHL